LSKIIRRDIHDGRLLELLSGLLNAGYMEDWRYRDTLSGTPQGGIISPLLANIYLNELDRFAEDTLIPAYTKGYRRRNGREYHRLTEQICSARRRGDLAEVKRLTLIRRSMPSMDTHDPDFRRLRYVRYADDFLLGFAGPKDEAEAIRLRLGEFLGEHLKLTLSQEKTLITHAHEDKAKFLGYEITAVRCNDLISANGFRAANAKISLLMPREVIRKYLSRYSKKGKVAHRPELLADADYTIVTRYQSVLRGLYNFYCMAVNVGNRARMHYLKWVLETSLTKTLARKHECRVSDIYRRYQVDGPDGRVLQVVVERPGKPALVATFGGFPLGRKPEGTGKGDFTPVIAWLAPGGKRSEVVQRMLADRCELCGAEGVALQMHHIRKLADIDRPGRRPKGTWEKIMAARKRKSLAVCMDCHSAIHAGRYDGPRL
jgi:hypothetical protein